MKLGLKILLSALLFLAKPICGMAQNKQAANALPVNGRVLTTSGLPVGGVIITIDDGKSKYSTDFDGKYSFSVSETSQFLFEYPGYKARSLSFSDLKNLNFEVILNLGANDLAELPYKNINKNLTVGNIDIINPGEEYSRDSRNSFLSAIEGKIAGSLGGMKLNGLGNAFFIVDGIPMGTDYIILQEIEQIVVLKDAVSRLLYSVESDLPVVLITTKKGQSTRNNLQVFAEHGVKQALAYPKFLDAAGYMEVYNQALRNDGATNGFFSSDVIKMTREGVDPVLYPNNDYYSSEYIKNMTNYTNAFLTASGGSEKTQYLLNLNWTNAPGWNQINNTVNNDLRVRGRVDFEATNWLKLNTSVLADYNFSKGPRSGNYWNKANTFLPSSFPELIPISRISNLESLGNYSLVNGAYLLGGTSIYQDNIYGDLLKNGNQLQMQRYVQSRLGFDLDLGRITKGLRSRGSIGFDYYNVYQQIINSSYSVYEIGAVDAQNMFPVTQIGVDKVTTEQTVDDSDLGFNRSIKWYYTLNYDRKFGSNEVSAVGLGYGSFYDENNISQTPREIAFGGQASYTMSDKYIVEGALLAQRSLKVNSSNRFGLSKAAGAAWLISEENFLRENRIVNYLKLRASYGQLLSDDFTSGPYQGYFLNENNFGNSSMYQYNNGLLSNRQIAVRNLSNQVGWQRRNELTIGMDAGFFKNKLGLEMSWFSSYSFDNVARLDALSPATIGNVSLFDNYNATSFQGINIGLKVNKNAGNLGINLAAYYTNSRAIIKKIAENNYNEQETAHLSQVKKDAGGLWGLTSERLYLQSDFDSNNNLLSGIPVPAWGQVRPGDIKYVDYNNDGIVNDDDRSLIGRNANNNLLSLNVDIKYRNWGLFLLPLVSWGGQGFKNSEYYWSQGNTAKYSVVALEAFDPNNPDPNASYPRLSQGSSLNNYRNSTFWLYQKSNFSLASAQISYNLLMKNNPVISQIRLYVRGTDLLMTAEDKDVLQLNFGGAPQARTVTIGAMVTF